MNAIIVIKMAKNKYIEDIIVITFIFAPIIIICSIIVLVSLWLLTGGL